MPGPAARAYLRAYKAAKKTDALFSKALVKEYGQSRASYMRYRPAETGTIKRLSIAKRKAEERMTVALRKMRAAGESVNNPVKLSATFRPAKIRMRNGKTVSAMARRNPKTGRVQLAVSRQTAKKMNPDLRFKDLQIGDAFHFPGRASTFGESIYKKTGPRTYTPLDFTAASLYMRKMYSGYPDILKKMRSPSYMKKTLAIKVGSTSAVVERD